MPPSYLPNRIRIGAIGAEIWDFEKSTRPPDRVKNSAYDKIGVVEKTINGVDDTTPQQSYWYQHLAGCLCVTFCSRNIKNLLLNIHWKNGDVGAMYVRIQMQKQFNFTASEATSATITWEGYTSIGGQFMVYLR